MINEEAKKELDKAIDNLENAMLLLHGEHKLEYSVGSNLYDFIYKFQPEIETIYGKMWAMSNALMNLYCEYKPDPADDKSWRERD